METPLKILMNLGSVEEISLSLKPLAEEEQSKSRFGYEETLIRRCFYK